MADAFTAGVKPGGLNNSTEIRILLCYLIKTAGPVTRDVMQGAILQEELVNYFEFVDALNEVESQQLAELRQEGYVITEKGGIVADNLSDELPRSVRDSAVRALIRIQSWVHKAAQNHAVVKKNEDGYFVECTIKEKLGNSFSLTIAMPDADTAEMVRTQFIARGSEIYSHLLNDLSEPLPDDEQQPEALL